MVHRAALVRLQDARDRPPQRARGRHAAGRDPAARARDDRGALPVRDARGLPGADRRPAGRRGVDGAGDRRGRRADLLRRAGRPRPRARAAAPDALERRRAGERRDARLPLVGRRGRRRDRRGAPGRRRAVQLLDRVRRGADPEGVPARRAGREPGARAAALPVRARLPAHRADRGLVPVRGQADGRHAGRAAGVPGRRDRRLGPRARRAVRRPRGVPREPARARRRDRRAAHRARLGGVRPGLRARAAEHGGAGDPHRDDRRGDRADLRRAARARGARPDPRPRPGRPGAPAGALQRRRGRAHHPHPRRLPPRPDHARRARLGDARLRGRAGAPDLAAAPEALAAARRRGHAALLQLRGGGLADPARPARARGLGGPRARRPSSTGYFEAVDTQLLPPGEDATRKILAIFELEKAVYELRYELNNRPDWAAIPAAGIVRLLESNGGT